MTNSELKNMIKSLEGIIKLIDQDTMDKSKEKFKNTVSKALNDYCKITIEKDEDGQTRLGVEGNRLSLLIALAGAEQGILHQLNCDEDEFEFIKSFIGTEEVCRNE